MTDGRRFSLIFETKKKVTPFEAATTSLSSAIGSPRLLSSLDISRTSIKQFSIQRSWYAEKDHFQGQITLNPDASSDGLKGMFRLSASTVGLFLNKNYASVPNILRPEASGSMRVVKVG